MLDSPANNAMAHFLHNALFLLGPAMDRSARPAEVQGELYRALPIESADTVACRVRTEAGADVLFLASHATELAIDPRFRLECDDAVITYGEQQGSSRGPGAATDGTAIPTGRRSSRSCSSRSTRGPRDAGTASSAAPRPR